MAVAAKNLQELEARAAFELECLSYPSRPWMTPRRHAGQPVYDVLIVGGGQSAVTIAFRLIRDRVTNIRVLDRNSDGCEGPWITFARMHSLRTPKDVSGPELGIPSLSARAWYEARFGESAWAGLYKIPRVIWHDYLRWLRRTAGVDINHDGEVTDIKPLPNGLLAVTARVAGEPQTLLARNVVLATGMEGSGRWLVPDMIKDALPRERYAHTAEAIDFAALAGRRVAVIGAGASAFDNAAMALEQGAAAVELYCRREKLPVINPNRWIEFTGFLRHFADLDDAMKWRFMRLIFDMDQPPPQDAFDRCARFANFSLHLGNPIESVELAGDAIALQTPHRLARADFLIVGTGFEINFAARPEMRRIAPHIALWSDRYRPPAGEESPRLGAYPYLSGCFQFTEKVPGTAPYLKNIFCYTYAAMPSLACTAGISQLKFGAERVGFGITRELFRDDADFHFDSFRTYREPELDPSAPASERPAQSERTRRIGIALAERQHMRAIPLRIGVSDSDRMRPLLDRQVTIPGVDAAIELMPVQALFNKQLTEHTFDCCEFPLTSYLRTLESAAKPYQAMPVFPSRHFRFSCVFVHAGSGIAKPADLAGKRVGIPVFDMAAAVWLRGIFEEHYGLLRTAPIYVSGGLEAARRGEEHPQYYPPQFHIEHVADRSLAELLAAGEIDALYTARAPSTWPSDHVTRLFDDPIAAEFAYFEKTGIFPPMHVIAIKRPLAEHHPGLPRKLFEAFSAAQRTAQHKLADSAALGVMLPWLLEHLRFTEQKLGADYWPVGFARNKKTLEVVIRYMLEDGLIKTRVAPEDLFVGTDLLAT